jgi:hypothetical protein
MAQAQNPAPPPQAPEAGPQAAPGHAPVQQKHIDAGPSPQEQGMQGLMQQLATLAAKHT